MKHINFFASIIFFALAVGFTIVSIQQNAGIENISAMALISIGIMYLLAFFYAFLGFRTIRYQDNVLKQHRENYRTLMSIYSKIDNSCSSTNSTLKNVFCSGVHEFGLLTFDILTGGYPKVVQKEAEDMFNELLRLTARLS